MATSKNGGTRHTAAARALKGSTIAIVGGSRGLGLDLAREAAEAGARIALCARDPVEVERARDALEKMGATVFAQTCDASRSEEADRFVRGALVQLGPIDMLITCAAIIQVGPLETMQRSDVEEALAQIFWTAYHPTMAVLPSMRARRAGRIVHVSSFGGQLGVPHMMPYCTSKFALTGFSASLRAELAKDGITVTTITPGLLRTGAHVNVPFKGQQEKEFLWFSAGATLPLVSLPSRQAARRILRHALRGDAESTLTPAIRLLVIANAVAPGLVSRMLALQNRLLPSAEHGETAGRRGMDVASSSRSRLVRALERYGRPNAEAHHAYPGPVHIAPGPQPLVEAPPPAGGTAS